MAYLRLCTWLKGFAVSSGQIVLNPIQQFVVCDRSSYDHASRNWWCPEAQGFLKEVFFIYFFFSSLFGLGRIYSRGNCKITQYCGRLLALNKPHLFGFTWLSISATHLSQFYEKLLASICKLIMQKSFKCKKACQWGQVTHNCLGAEAVDDKH